MIAAPLTLFTALVTILALIFYLATSVVVAQMRAKHGVKAPATSGHPMFDRAFRVQMNTLEHLPVFLPALWLTAFYFSPLPAIAPVLGVVWIVGRGLYMTSYLKDPEKRGPGFGICGLAEVLLLLLALGGVLMALLTTV